MQAGLTVGSILFGIAAGGFGLWAAVKSVRDSQDDFISDLRKQSRIAAIAAACAATSSVLLAVQYFLGTGH